MPLRKAYPIRYSYRGLCDAADGTDLFPGAAANLANFVFDRDNPEWIVPRPGVTPLTTFGGFNTPGFISIHAVIEPKIYGMIGTARNVNKDEPFVYDNSTQAFNACTNVLAGNVPATPLTSGAWVPPTLATIGSRVIITHPGFPGGVGGLFFGVIDTSSFTLNTMGTTQNGNATITAVASTAGLSVGMTITGAGIPANSWIVSWTANTITINVNCTGNNNGTALQILGGTPAAPLWGAGNLNTNALPGVPTCVVNFNNRAYYAVGNTIYWSDVLNPTVMTNATQSLVIGDGSAIVAMYGASVQTSSGGVTASLFIFKKGNQIWQFVGDQATGNTALAQLSPNVGTLGPRSIVATPDGLYFQSVDGPKLIDLNAVISPLMHDEKGSAPDLALPFRNATTPSRMASAFASQVYRTCLDTVIKGQQVSGYDYWFDTTKRRWNGPHSFAFDCASAYQNYFVLSSKNVPGTLFKSQPYSDINSVFMDNGANYNCSATSCTLPKIREMTEKMIVETTTELAYLNVPNDNYQVTILDEQGAVLDQVAISTYQTGSLWGSFTWGVSLWSSIFSVPHVFNVPWDVPIVFQKASVQHSIQATAGIAVGTTYMRYQDTGYTTTVP